MNIVYVTAIYGVAYKTFWLHTDEALMGRPDSRGKRFYRTVGY